jgi:hypothetical protein
MVTEKSLMSQDKKILEVIKNTQEKYSAVTGTGWNKAFEEIFNRTKSKCRDLVLLYREENPDVAPHIESVSNQVLSNIVQLKNEYETETFKNSVRLDLLNEISEEIKNLNSKEASKDSKKKQEKSEELEK